jgi:hypothetical protein
MNYPEINLSDGLFIVKPKSSKMTNKKFYGLEYIVYYCIWDNLYHDVYKTHGYNNRLRRRFSSNDPLPVSFALKSKMIMEELKNQIQQS